MLLSNLFLSFQAPRQNVQERKQIFAQKTFPLRRTNETFKANEERQPHKLHSGEWMDHNLWFRQLKFFIQSWSFIKALSILRFSLIKNSFDMKVELSWLNGMQVHYLFLMIPEDEGWWFVGSQSYRACKVDCRAFLDVEIWSTEDTRCGRWWCW